MTRFFNWLFSAATGWAILRFVAVAIVIYMAVGFIYPIAVRAGGTGKYVVTQAPNDLGNWVGDRLGLKKDSAAVTKPTPEKEAAAEQPAFGGPTSQPTSVGLANQAREDERRAQELRFQAQKKLLWANTFAQGEAQERALASNSPDPRRTVKVTVYDQNKQPVAIDHQLLVDRSGVTETIPVTPNSTKNLQVGYGPLRFQVGAIVPGAGYSDFQTVEFSADEVGAKTVQLQVTMPTGTKP